MKRFYSNEHAKCEIRKNPELPAEMQERVREVINVWTDPESRQQGYATQLMQTVCEEADLENKVLILTPKPFDNTCGVGREKLISFYKRFGFVVTQKDHVLMARAPTFKVRQTLVSAAIEKATRG